MVKKSDQKNFKSDASAIPPLARMPGILLDGSAFAKTRLGDSVEFARFSPDGRWVVTASSDKTAQVWPFAEYSPSADVTALIAAGEYSGGLTIDSESGLLRPLSGPELVELQRRLMKMRQDPLYGNLVRWIVDPPDQQPASPLMDKPADVRQPAK
jgi:hypothetical protein